MQARTAIGATLAAAAVLPAAAGAAPVQGSISGPVTAVKGRTFVVKTTLSPTGSAKVTVTAKTAIREQVAGTRANLKKGVCVTATGTKKGATVTAARISLTPAVKGACGARFGGRPRGGSGGPPGGGRPPGSGNGNGFARPANFGFASGRVALVAGSTLTVKGRSGSTKVVVSAKTQIGRTVLLNASGVRKSLCAFVFGTSTDKGVTVTATDVSLSKPVGGSCTFRGRRGP